MTENIIENVSNLVADNSDSTGSEVQLEKMRPLRKLIQIISSFPKDVINEVSPNTASRIKPYVKVPMILIMGVCGIMAGITSIFFKFLGELVESDEFTTAPGLTTSLIIVGFFGAWVMFYTLTWAMKYFD